MGASERNETAHASRPGQASRLRAFCMTVDGSVGTKRDRARVETRAVVTAPSDSARQSRGASGRNETAHASRPRRPYRSERSEETWMGTGVRASARQEDETAQDPRAGSVTPMGRSGRSGTGEQDGKKRAGREKVSRTGESGQGRPLSPAPTPPSGTRRPHPRARARSRSSHTADVPDSPAAR